MWLLCDLPPSQLIPTPSLILPSSSLLPPSSHMAILGPIYLPVTTQSCHLCLCTYSACRRYAIWCFSTKKVTMGLLCAQALMSCSRTAWGNHHQECWFGFWRPMCRQKECPDEPNSKPPEFLLEGWTVTPQSQPSQLAMDLFQCSLNGLSGISNHQVVQRAGQENTEKISWILGLEKITGKDIINSSVMHCYNLTTYN